MIDENRCESCRNYEPKTDPLLNKEGYIKMKKLCETILKVIKDEGKEYWGVFYEYEYKSNHLDIDMYGYSLSNKLFGGERQQ